MRSRKGEIKIDGFWLFLIGIFIVLPMIRHLTKSDKEGTLEEGISSVQTQLEDSNEVKAKVVVTTRKAQPITVNDGRTSAPVGVVVCFEVKKGAVRASANGPDKTKTPGGMKGQFAYFTFDEVGDWDVDVHDKNGTMIEWIRVTVY